MQFMNGEFTIIIVINSNSSVRGWMEGEEELPRGQRRAAFSFSFSCYSLLRVLALYIDVIE